MYLKVLRFRGSSPLPINCCWSSHNGITGIVGPNGKRKSNVDARALGAGEQRIKQLRGASMQDVIFAGTEMRKPQGFACGAITLDNSDHQLAH